METTQSIAVTTLITSLVSLFGYLIKINHRRIRSKCCNKPCVTSIDVEETTPEPSTTVVREVEPPKL